MENWRRSLASCIGLSILALPGASIAQVPGATRDVGAPTEPVELKPPSGMQLQAPQPPAPELRTAGTVTIERFRFSGLTAVDASELERVLAPWTGRPINVSELEEALKAVTAFLRERGLYAAYARFPDQNVADGVAQIEIVEGRVGRIEVQQEPGARLRPWVASGFLSSLKPGLLIARGELDTPLLLLNDLPGLRVEPSLTSGAEPGTADLTVKVEDEPLVAGFVRLDNHQIRELGEVQLTGHLRLRNPLGIGDLATAEAVRSHTGEWLRGTFAYSVPVNYQGTRVGALFSNQRYRLGGDFEPLLANGDGKRYSAGATHPFVRRDDRNLSGSFSLTHVEYRDRIDAAAISSQSRHRFATARLGGDRTDGILGGGVSAFYVEYQRGNVSLDTAASALDAAGLNAAGGFSRGRLHVGRTQRLWTRANLYVSWTAQLASKNLAAGQEILLSGPDAVRAYPAAELIADEGYLAKVEYRHLFPLGAGWHSVATLFADQAHGRTNKNPIIGTTGNSRDIWGYGLSLTATRLDTFNAQVVLAWRGSEAPLTDSGRNPRVWVYVTQYF